MADGQRPPLWLPTPDFRPLTPVADYSWLNANSE